MELEDANETTLCKCFEVTLAGPASCWYNLLPSCSICSFGELWKFSTHIIGSRRSCKRAIQMFDVTQRPNESIREFVECFNREVINASNLMDDIRIMAFVKALPPRSRLAHELSRKNPTNVEEIYSVTHEHMVAQELLSQRKIKVSRVQEPRAEGRRDRGTRSCGGASEESFKRSHPLTPREPTFSPC